MSWHAERTSGMIGLFLLFPTWNGLHYSRKWLLQELVYSDTDTFIFQIMLETPGFA